MERKEEDKVFSLIFNKDKFKIDFIKKKNNFFFLFLLNFKIWFTDLIFWAPDSSTSTNDMRSSKRTWQKKKSKDKHITFSGLNVSKTVKIYIKIISKWLFNVKATRNWQKMKKSLWKVKIWQVFKFIFTINLKNYYFFLTFMFY